MTVAIIRAGNIRDPPLVTEADDSKTTNINNGSARHDLTDHQKRAAANSELLQSSWDDPRVASSTFLFHLSSILKSSFVTSNRSTFLSETAKH